MEHPVIISSRNKVYAKIDNLYACNGPHIVSITYYVTPVYPVAYVKLVLETLAEKIVNGQ